MEPNCPIVLLPGAKSVRPPSGGKIVHVWAARYDGDLHPHASNTFRIEWPPRSGRYADFPEVDKAEWFDRAAAAKKILKSQLSLLDEFYARVAPS